MKDTTDEKKSVRQARLLVICPQKGVKMSLSKVYSQLGNLNTHPPTHTHTNVRDKLCWWFKM